MKRKAIPAILMLTAGLFTALITYIKDYPLVKILVLTLCALIVFYMVGSVIKYVLDSFYRKNEQSLLESGEVIPKEENDEISNDV